MKLFLSITIGICTTTLLVSAATAEDSAKPSSDCAVIKSTNKEPHPIVAADIKALAQSGLADYMIGNEIRNSQTVFHLSSADIIDLNKSGVSESIINSMISTAASPANNGAGQTNLMVTTDDLKALGKAKLNDHLIMNQIATTRTVFHLSGADIIDLKNTGVSDRVIGFAINTPSCAVEAGAPPDLANLAGMGGILPVTGDAWVDAWARDALRSSYGSWINGYWSRDRFGRLYRALGYPGNWENVSPLSQAVWIKGYWSRDAYGHRYLVRGHWG